MNSSLPYKPKLVILLSRFPFPTEKGDKLRAYYQILELAKVWEVHLICLTEKSISEAQKDAIKIYTKELHIFKLSRIRILTNVLFQFFTKKPFQVGYFYQKKVHKKINGIINECKPDHIYTQLIRTTEYVKNYHNCPKTLDYMDTLSAGMKRRISTEPWYKKWLFRSEWKRLSHYENIIFDYFELHTIISAQDRELIAHPGRSKIEVIPNGVGTHFFNKNIQSKTPEFDLVFTGNLSYPPNISAVKYIVNEILPEAKKRNLELKVLVSGANPSPEVMKHSDRIEITGWVEDIRASYSKGKIFVAPMFIGTGLQNKLLEAMAMELPCITTPLANNALGASENEICLAESPVEFVDWIDKMLKNIYFASKIATNGQHYVQQHFDWQQTTAKLSDKMLVLSK